MGLTHATRRLSWSPSHLLRLSISIPVTAPSRLQRYLSVISRWLLILGLVFVLTMLAGQFVTDHLLTQSYTATAQIQIRPNGAKFVVGNPTKSFFPDATEFQAEFSLMRSSKVLLPAIHDLNLRKAWAKRINKSKEDLSDFEALSYLNKNLKLDFIRGTTIINVTVTDDDPKEAADIANTIADQYKARRNAANGNASEQSPVRILARAAIPTKPDPSVGYIVTIIVAGILSIVVASFVEMILLFLRASERHEN